MVYICFTSIGYLQIMVSEEHSYTTPPQENDKKVIFGVEEAAL